MKKKQKLLVALMALTLAGGVGSALALGAQSASKSYSGNFDTMAYLTWGATSHTSYNLGDVDNLAIGVAQYKYFQVLPKTSSGLSGTAKVSFALAVGDGANDVLTGLSISVYRHTAEINAENITTYATSTYRVGVLDSSNLGLVNDITVSAGNTSTKTFYALGLLYSGGVATGKDLGATLTISLDFVQAA